MQIDRQTYAVATAEFTVDLRTITAHCQPGDVQSLAEFDIEVVGNDTAVTMTGMGSFAGSAHFAFADGTFAIGGGKRAPVGKWNLAEIKFTRTGTTPYTINITRQIGG